MIRASLYGRLGGDPVERATRNGNTMAKASLAVHAARFGEEEATVWFSLAAFGRVADDLLCQVKGDLVAAMGQLTRRRYTDRDGVERESWSLTVDSIVSAPELPPTAFRIAMRGIAVFPLSAGTKVPLAGTRGYLDASSDSDVTRARWLKHPLANIGAATGARSNFWVLDVDPRHGGDAALQRLEGEHGPLPVTVEALTPSGGKHLYWRWQVDGPEIRNSTSRVGPGLDVRGEGGSITMPPSRLRDGRAYRWAQNGARGFADAPAWLVALTQPPPPPPRAKTKPLNGDVDRYCARAIADELRRLEEATDGQRNDQLNRTAFAIGQFVAAGAVPEDWARGTLESHAVQIGLPAHEARGTIGSAFKAARPRELPR